MKSATLFTTQLRNRTATLSRIRCVTRLLHLMVEVLEDLEVDLVHLELLIAMALLLLILLVPLDHQIVTVLLL